MVSRGSPSRSQALAATISGIQAAGYADDEMLSAGRGHAAQQAFDLDVEGLVAVVVEALRIVGDEGKPPQAAPQTPVGAMRPVLEGDAPKPHFRMAARGGAIVERAHPHPLEAAALQIDVGDQQFRLVAEPAGGRQRLAQFVDDALTVPGQVGGALAGAGRRIDVGGERAGRLRGGEHRPLPRFADDDVGGAEIAQHQGPGHRRVG
jgi:hypothetical protein